MLGMLKIQGGSMERFKQFYRQSYKERVEKMNDFLLQKESPNLSDEIADQMIENFVYKYPLPLGIATNFLINNKEYLIPMAIEEPSVVAAASNGAKRVGNIQVATTKRELIGQIVLSVDGNPDEVVERLHNASTMLLDLAKETIPSMVERGGGPTRLWVEQKEHHQNIFVTLYLAINPCDAMGANVMNTVLEALSVHIEDLTGYRSLLNILSNYTEEAITKATVSIPIASLGQDETQSRQIAERIAQASLYAQLDKFRAVTHNKGIMNGMDAVILATGNDWRAVEAAIHAYASRTGEYRGLSQWVINDAKHTLEGSLELPLPVATVGGTLSIHPFAKQSLVIMQCSNATQLANIIAAVGLAQNFSALRALVTDGIQKGHMSMQARSLALQVGANVDEVGPLVSRLKRQPHMNRQIAHHLLEAIRREQNK